jgi:transcriptional regulator with XRE-family HTH domain
MAAARRYASMVAFGREVRKRRRGRKMTIWQLAQASGLTQHYIAGIEHGARNPSLGSMLSIADGLSLPLAEMLGGFEDLTADGLEAGRLTDALSTTLREPVLAILRALVEFERLSP